MAATKPKRAPAGSRTQPQRHPTGLQRAESWLSAHLDWFVAAIVLAGLILRWQRASGIYFNADEAQISVAPLQHGFLQAVRATPIPYGPLVTILLYPLAALGESEMLFRLPSILAGALVPAAAYLWLARLFDKSTAFCAAVILTFSPPMINLSAQIRYYMIHLLFITLSLYCLERAFSEKSIRWIRYFGATMLLATLTLYMSAWYIGGAGVYALVRILRRELPRRIVIEWAAIQAGIAVILVSAYLVMSNNPRVLATENSARNSWLSIFYYQPERTTILQQLNFATDSLFSYIFANDRIGWYMLIVFAAGLAVTLAGRAPSPSGRWLPALHITLPLALTAAASILRLYPFGGSRHSAFLALYIAAGAALAIAFLLRRKLTLLVPAALCLTPYWLAAEQHHFLDDFPEINRLDMMRGALAYTTQLHPAPRTWVVDQQGNSFLNYYVCHGEMRDWRNITPTLVTYRCGSYLVVQVEAWDIGWRSLGLSLEQARRDTPGGIPEPAWRFAVGGPPAASENIQTQGQTFGRIEIRRMPSPPQPPPR